MIRAHLSALVLLAVSAIPAAAQTPVASSAPSPVLIELFASHNCRACPKAHRTMSEVAAERDDVLILTWSVDYWDYLGEKDPMAMAESKDRQRSYVDRFRLRGPYTPQTVYNGLEQCPGSKPPQVRSALQRVSKADASPARLVRKGAKIELTGAITDLTDIFVIEYLDGEANPTDMVHPVTKVTSIGPWIGGRVEIDPSVCPTTCALVVQEAGFGRVLAAMDLRN
ncbi:MAG: DUF1223 domain-containing protein [Pseudomonadota bacterium]|uniref:DUF1223 domain-containing protein n=1 Tax=Hyphomonas sp. BRH_c22 TaxID=1629710 RepID=UPI0026314036|nr:DUF1223 domain-containing protein [Hyphomonas sp. BRH_c22]